MVDPHDGARDLPAELRVPAEKRAAEFRAATDLPASGVAVIHGFEGLTYRIRIVPRADGSTSIRRVG